MRGRERRRGHVRGGASKSVAASGLDGVGCQLGAGVG